MKKTLIQLAFNQPITWSISKWFQLKNYLYIHIINFFLHFFFRCDGESFCDIEVNSGVFGDPCPNTHKYVEVHYACSSNFGRLEGGTTTKKLPPWFLQGSAGLLRTHS